MKKELNEHNPADHLNKRVKIVGAVTLLLVAFGGPARAQVTFDVIGPHEYDLPTNFAKPFNIFVQYVESQSTSKTWDAGKDKQNVSRTSVLVGLTKYVRLWTLDANPDIGLAWEVIVPEIGVRNNAANTSTGGFGDPLIGPVIWYKPTANVTLGALALVTPPVGDPDVGGGDQFTYHLTPFWHVNAGKLAYTGQIGAKVFGHSSKLNGKQGNLIYTNHRFGYRVTELFEPFLSLDQETQSSSSVNLKSSESAVGVGAMFHYYGNQSLTFRYAKGVAGENHSVTDIFNIKYVYVF